MNLYNENGKDRTRRKGVVDDEALGPLRLLPGTWANRGQTREAGWNMIALPFAPGRFRYRVLMNQYTEVLRFSLVDDKVPNRGVEGPNREVTADQLVVTIDYQQTIDQVAAADSPDSGLAGKPGAAIHHEPGLFLHMRNHRTANLDIARLATVPHGDSALALGTSMVNDGGPAIPANVDGLPIGAGQDVQNNPYLAPYKHFVNKPFKGKVRQRGFPGFNPIDMTALLALANQGVDIARTTTLPLDTSAATGGIVNIPFIVDQANAALMTSTFWIQELRETDKRKRPKLRMQYLQIVMLDFFERRDGQGLIRWPHISINTMDKISDEVLDDVSDEA